LAGISVTNWCVLNRLLRLGKGGILRDMQAAHKGLKRRFCKLILGFAAGMLTRYSMPRSTLVCFETLLHVVGCCPSCLLASTLT
jgi:hypothetical protein